MSVLCVCCNVCFEIEIWIGLKAVGHYRGALHFLMVLHFLVSICDEYFQFGASLDKIHKINRCRAVSVMRSDAESLSGPAELCRVTLSCTGGMQCCTECLTIWIREGKGRVLQISGARCQSDSHTDRNEGEKFPGCCNQQFEATIL